VASAATAHEWADAMRRGIIAAPIDSDLAAKMAEALGGMARGMVRSPPN